jgi:MFS family permease
VAGRTESGAVYAAGVAQGIVLVTFPAASTVFTDPAEYDLSSTQYGALFLPQVITAIAAALLGAGLSGRFGTKRVYVVGLAASLLSMVVLIVSQFLTEDELLAYGLLLVATAFLGVGFGLSVPADDLCGFGRRCRGHGCMVTRSGSQPAEPRGTPSAPGAHSRLTALRIIPSG